MNETDVLVIGASAAGLATAAQLQRHGLRFEVLEAADVVAQPWRKRYDRLHLHTPRSASGLPGLAMPGDWPRYPSRDQVVEYLDRYRVHHRLAPIFESPVTRLERADGGWLAGTPSGPWRAGAVVVATGANRVPVRPTWPGQDEFTGWVRHSVEYRNGRDLRDRSVLVVGFGNSACEIALDLLESGARPTLSVRSAVNVLPRDMFGLVPVLQLGIVMQRLPLAVADALAAPLVRLTVGDVRRVGLRKLPYGPNTQIVRHRQVPLLDIGTMAQIRSRRIAVRPGIERFTPDGVSFTDGRSQAVDAVVLATGFRPGLEELLPDWQAVCDGHGIPASGRETALPGLYFCGQYVSPAGMLREIGIEARRIAASLASRRPAVG
jgi:indole-3-pyruvate monooxygenase